ncbi:MAG: hypothetical protein LBV36_03785 [Chromatiales bacterium]|nr:hypothetical protein [Chromatiales bacterium]
MSHAAKTSPTTSAQEIEIKEQRAAGAQPEELIELLQVSHPRLHAANYTLHGNGRFISVYRKTLMRSAQRYWLDLSVLDPTPHLLTVVNKRWLYIALSLTLAAAGLLTASAMSPLPWHQQSWMPGTIMVLNAALVSFVLFIQRSRSLVRFHSRHGDAVMLELANNLPSKNEFRDFLRTLITHIQTANRTHAEKAHRRLGAELVEHRRLHEAGLLDRDAYDQAREKILRLHRQAQPAPKKPAQGSAAAGISVAEIPRGKGGIDLFGEKTATRGK